MKRRKGISLILLVITIIVIIILAGTVMLSLSSNNPISQASEATFKTNVVEYNSELLLAITTQYLTKHTFDSTEFDAKTWDGNEPVGDTIKKYITTITADDGIKYEIQDSKLVYVGGNQTEIDMLLEIGIPNGPALTIDSAGLTIGEIADTNQTINGEPATYMNPIIPAGFMAVNDGTVWPTNWNTGLVIQDINGNQFVWVPVNGTSVTYVKWDAAVTYVSSATTTEDGIPTEVSDETTQVTTYGGFYIARYEAGKDGTTLVSKKNATLWNSVGYVVAKSVAESMYTTGSVRSALLTGRQWDSTMKWLENSLINVSTNSRTWGNYYNSEFPANIAECGTVQVAGFSEFWKSNNIYDLAGNTYEWTNEMFETDYMLRGGEETAGYRLNYNADFEYDGVSFRTVLYIL